LQFLDRVTANLPSMTGYHGWGEVRIRLIESFAACVRKLSLSPQQGRFGFNAT
jgi:hypothetical protein